MPESDLDQVVRDPASGATEETTQLADWRRRWEAEQLPPLPSPDGPVGWWARLKLLIKRRLRRWALGSQWDLWESQRIYNLRILNDLDRRAGLEAMLASALARLEKLEPELPRLGADLQQVQSELVRDLRDSWQAQERELQKVHGDLLNVRDQHDGYLRSHRSRLDVLEGLRNDGFDELRTHLDALYSRLDQKLDDYRRHSRQLWSELRALLAAVDADRPQAVIRTARDRDYVALEEVFRGREEEIERRIDPYLDLLRGRGEVLDLGCGRGEALEVLARNGISCRGVDSSAEMVAICRAKGLASEEGELFDSLERLAPGSLGGIVSFHVIEHLPADSLDRLVRLAWRGLAAGGVLALETPSPLSLVVAARNFWLDPTHRRPVHPETLQHSFRRAGFDPVQRLDLQPFAAEERLHEISTEGLAPELGRLVERINRLRDELDGILFGFQDYGMVGFKPEAGAELPPTEDRAAG